MASRASVYVTPVLRCPHPEDYQTAPREYPIVNGALLVYWCRACRSWQRRWLVLPVGWVVRR